MFRPKATAEFVNADTRGALLAVAPPATRWLVAGASLVLFVGVTLAIVGRIRTSADGRGDVRPSEAAVPVLAAQTIRVTAVKHAAGDTVQAGDVLFELDTSEAAQAVGSCNQSVQRIRANRAVAQSQLDAQLKQGQPEEAILYLLQQRVERGDDLLEQEGIRCDKLADAAAHSKVTSPIDGTVVEMKAHAGAPAKEGDTLALVLPVTAKLHAFVHVPESEIGRIDPGAVVYLRLDAYPYESYGMVQGSVVRILDGTDSDAAEETHHTRDASAEGEDLRKVVEVELGAVPKEVKIRGGLRFSASIVTGERSVASVLFPR